MTITHAQPADLPSSSFFAQPLPRNEFPEQGMRPRDALDLIHLGLRVDGQPSMNLASFVTTSMEPEARQLIAEALH
ncbi:MAG: glutamate decarboxylase, partial [Acidimicrobiales bacterium]